MCCLDSLNKIGKFVNADLRQPNDCSIAGHWVTFYSKVSEEDSNCKKPQHCRRNCKNKWRCCRMEPNLGVSHAKPTRELFWDLLGRWEMIGTWLVWNTHSELDVIIMGLRIKFILVCSLYVSVGAMNCRVSARTGSVKGIVIWELLAWQWGDATAAEGCVISSYLWN